jgi:hypothetical protein
MQTVRFTKGARKHRVGKYRARYVMETSEPLIIPDARGRGDKHLWVGLDQRGIELEIIAVEVPDCLLVIHVMQTHLRRLGGRDE